MTNINKINKAFKSYRRNPNPETKLRLIAAISVHSDDCYAQEAIDLICRIGTCDVPETHKAMIEAANQTGTDLGTLSGGPTPED